MNAENEHCYFHVEVLEKSTRAVKVKLNRDGSAHWVPWSLCDLRPNSVLEVEKWFAEKEGMTE